MVAFVLENLKLLSLDTHKNERRKEKIWSYNLKKIKNG